jgi:TonB family protein
MREPTSETAEQVKLKVVAAISPGEEEASKLASAKPESVCSKPNPGSAGTTSAVSTNAPKPAPQQSRHPATLQQILADPGASEEDWLAACYEMESHPNYKGVNSKPSAISSDLKRLLQSCAVITLVGVSGVMVANNLSNSRPSPLPPPPPPAQNAQVQVDFGPYMANLQRQIKRSWYPPKADATARAKVIFKVAQDGEMSYLRMITPGPNEAFDRAALAAVRDASKSFRPLPVGSPKDVDIEFTFDYNVFDRAQVN